MLSRIARQLDNAQSFFQLLTGYRKYIALFLLGGFMTLAMAPVGLFPALFIAIPAAIWILRTATRPLHAFLGGWALGAGYFIFGLYWISAALFVDIAQWIWVMPFSLIAGPGLFGLYWGLPALAAHRLRAAPVHHSITFVAALALTEYARGHLMTGFPWNLPGYGWSRVAVMEQLSSIGGVYLLTLLTLFWAAAPAYRTSKPLLGLSLLTLVLSLSYGCVRLLDNPTVFTTTAVRIIQPNIPQDQKWDRDKEWRNFEATVKLVAQSSTWKPQLFVMPETAVRADLSTFPEIARFIAQHMPDNGVLITGNLRVTDHDGLRFYNSIEVMDSKARVLGTYDKHHLVPFGEFIPFRDRIRIAPIAAAVSGIGDFTRGTGPATIRGDAFPAFSPLVCYEVIFPNEVVAGNDRPAWLVNATNDAWYGNSSGPYQHLDISRMRAIEHGLPMARAANTGISAMIDPVGRIVDIRPLGERGYIDSFLPEALPRTIYDRVGDWIFIFISLFGLLPLVRRSA